jgi:hypothetical protein
VTAPADELVTISEAARIARVPEDLLRAMLVKGLVPVVRVAAFEVRVRRADVEAIRRKRTA